MLLSKAPHCLRLEAAPEAGDAAADATRRVAGELAALGFPVTTEGESGDRIVTLRIGGTPAAALPGERHVPLRAPGTLLEAVLREAHLDFDSLPLLVEGESKVVRLWTDQVVAVRFKPTVYSYTTNRYGEAEGTDRVRLRFTAAIFRAMAEQPSRAGVEMRSAFLAEIPHPDGPFLIERRVESCNVETRIKRYHIGSPLHRYRYTERYPSTQVCGPITQWSRFDDPVVCFDWRHPLCDSQGVRLADEPISDDYAAVWMRDVPYAKELARQVFLWLEELFEAADLRLVDMCLFIDAAGRVIYGEISPDCMRVRLGCGRPEDAPAADKDLWRSGHSSQDLRLRYEELYRRISADL